MKSLHYTLVLCITLVFTSCIPFKIAPNTKNGKLMSAKRAGKTLPKQCAFVFQDSKDANEFYNYINIKFQLNDQNVDFNVPIKVNEKEYFLSFYESKIETKTVNLVPIIIDAKLEQEGFESSTPLLQDTYTSRWGKWNIVLTVTDNNNEDSLAKDYQNRDEVIAYLKGLRTEYLNTHNYYEILLSK